MVTVAQYIINRLEQEVNHDFCCTGGASIYLTDALNDSKIKPVFLLHEQACGIAAEAYAQFPFQGEGMRRVRIGRGARRY